MRRTCSILSLACLAAVGAGCNDAGVAVERDVLRSGNQELAFDAPIWSREGQLFYDVWDGPLDDLPPVPVDTYRLEFGAEGQEGTVLTAVEWGEGVVSLVAFSEDGVIEPIPPLFADQSNLVPSGTDLFSAAANQTGVTQLLGETVVRRVPAEVADDELAIRSEIRSTLVDVDGSVLRSTFEVFASAVDNEALGGLRADFEDDFGMIAAIGINALIDDATEPRLTAFGTVAFDVEAGHMVSAEFTGAGLPTEDMPPDELAATETARTYSITLRN